jgi:hypothetical protein
MTQDADKPIAEYAPSLASLVFGAFLLVMGALLLLQIPRVTYWLWVGYQSDEIPMVVTHIEDSTGRGGAVTFACRAPSGEEIQSAVGTRELESFTMGQKTNGKIFQYLWGVACVPNSHISAQPFGVIFLVFLLFIIGGGALQEGLNLPRLLLLRKLLRQGAPIQGVIKGLTQQKSKRLEWFIVEYEFSSAQGNISGSVRLLSEVNTKWSFMLHKQKIFVSTAPQIGQPVKLLHEEKNPHKHVFIGF